MIEIRRADLANPTDAAALVQLLDEYARDPAGGGEALSSRVRAELPERLARLPHAHCLLAWREQQAIGLVNAFEGFSTFAAQPLLNIHDLCVTRSKRGQGVGRQLLEAARELARDLGCCKLTLEVLEGNEAARQLYLRFGFRDYQLRPDLGHARFMQLSLDMPTPGQPPTPPA